MAYVDDSWYVVARRCEVGDDLLERRVIGRSLVLYRTSAGAAVALANRCPHRGFPLSAGTRVGDRVRCGYHGFTFDCDGACVSVPGQERVPSRADVRAYPVVEHGPFVWVWTGDPERADPALVPHDFGLEEPGWQWASGLVPIACDYELVVDNLLDLSHETFVHATRIGTPEVAETPVTTTVDESRHRVAVSRHMEGVTCPPSYAATAGFSSPIDRWQDAEYAAPSLYLLRSRIAPAGLRPEDTPGDRGAHHGRIFYAMTPETPGRTLYFFALGRQAERHDPTWEARAVAVQHELIAEDAAVMEAVQSLNDAEGPAHEVSIKIDAGGLAARRMLRALLAAD